MASAAQPASRAKSPPIPAATAQPAGTVRSPVAGRPMMSGTVPYQPEPKNRPSCLTTQVFFLSISPESGLKKLYLTHWP